MTILENSIELTKGNDEVTGTLYDLYLYLRENGKKKNHSQMMSRFEKNISSYSKLGSVNLYVTVYNDSGQSIETYKMSQEPFLAFAATEDVDIACEIVSQLKAALTQLHGISSAATAVANLAQSNFDNMIMATASAKNLRGRRGKVQPYKTLLKIGEYLSQVDMFQTSIELIENDDTVSQFAEDSLIIADGAIDYERFFGECSKHQAVLTDETIAAITRTQKAIEQKRIDDNGKKGLS